MEAAELARRAGHSRVEITNLVDGVEFSLSLENR